MLNTSTRVIFSLGIREVEEGKNKIQMFTITLYLLNYSARTALYKCQSMGR